ncbi:MAG: hypothetical protein WCI73_16525, partial [Phycisphaerae bacterium]
LGMSFQEKGRWVDTPSRFIGLGFGIFLGYTIGSLVDRLKPLRVMPFLFFARALVLTVGFFVVKDKISAMVISSLEGVVLFCMGISIGALTVEIFPMAKLGQFCSAQAFFYQTIILFLSIPIGKFFDWIKFNRFGYIWGATFSTLAGFVAIKVYYNWKHLHQDDPVAEPGGFPVIVSPPDEVSGN